MGDLFWNKLIGAFLGTWLALFAITEASHVLVHPHELEEAAYPIEVADEGSGPVEEDEAVDVGTMLAEADPDAGETFATTLCGTCHTFGQGEGALTGPNLWNVVGRSVGAVEGFNYSPAMQDHGGSWTYDLLWVYLERPQGEVPGTAMTFAGITRENQRANVIAYLATLSDDPVPFPEPAAAEEEMSEETATEDAVAETVADEAEAATPEEAAAEDAAPSEEIAESEETPAPAPEATPETPDEAAEPIDDAEAPADDEPAPEDE